VAGPDQDILLRIWGGWNLFGWPQIALGVALTLLLVSLCLQATVLYGDVIAWIAIVSTFITGLIVLWRYRPCNRDVIAPHWVLHKGTVQGLRESGGASFEYDAKLYELARAMYNTDGKFVGPYP
jgi:hypothetical protein